jgi:hypothetical protein
MVLNALRTPQHVARLYTGAQLSDADSCAALQSTMFFMRFLWYGTKSRVSSATE